MQPNRDEKGRLRSKTVAFRVSPEEYDEIQMLSDISGLTKQDYLLLMSRGRNVTVHCVRRFTKSSRPAKLSSDSAQIEQWDRPD